MSNMRPNILLSHPNASLVQLAEHGNSIDQSEDQRILKPKSTAIESTLTKTSQTVLVVSLLVGLLFASLDTAIVSTSLVTISHDLNDYTNAPWIILAYLLTYMGFAVCISKLSDIYGRKNMLVLSWVLFTAFSLGCGSAKSMTALITCRSFQGIGASGLYSLTQIGLVEVGPCHRPSLIGALIGATLAVAFVLGPIIGGAVSQLSDWRWLFNLNIPFGLVAILSITNFWPPEQVAHMLSWKTFTTIDFIGSITLLFSSGLIVFAVQQAGSRTLHWNSPEVISALVVSATSLAIFIWWEIALDRNRFRHIAPVFPIRLMRQRVYSTSLIITFITGFLYIALSVVIPERLQIVDNVSVLMAGVQMLPLLGSCAAGSFLGGALSCRKNNTSYTLVAAAFLQLLGVGLMTMLSENSSNRISQYLFQAVFGMGVGLCFSAATIMTNIVASEPTERAPAQGAVAQARVFGGCLGLSICTVVFNSNANRYLETNLNTAQLGQLQRSPLSGLQLPAELRSLVKAVYAAAFAEEIKLMALICSVMVVVSLFTLEKQPAPLERLTARQRISMQSHRRSESQTEMHDTVSIHHTV